MSRFFSEKYSSLVPYTPGEQPKDTQYIKLNTNESPYKPSPLAIDLAQKAACNLELYSDPTCSELVKTAAERFNVSEDEIIFTNGSDEILNFAFMAFCDNDTPAVFADITYGFYKVFAQINNVPSKVIPLNSDFTICVDDYKNANGTVFIANPNAPTGIALSLEEIEEIVISNPDNIVVIDEAYVDFGAESAVILTKKYPNLLVTQTFSKSRSLAGGRLGFGIASKEIITDLNTVRYSTNPYNVNSVTMAAGIGALKDKEYFTTNCKKIIKTREWTENELKKLGFVMTDSLTNFLFAKHPDYSGKNIYLKLKEKGVLVRHFDTDKLTEYNRITIGSDEQMEIFIDKLKEVLEELK